MTQLVAEDGSRVYVVGTAHFSDDSKRDVVKTIREVQPDVVVVELCQYRVSMLKMDERTLLREAKEVSLEKLQQAVKQNGLMSGLMQMLLLKVSAHITEQLGMAPGGEFRRPSRRPARYHSANSTWVTDQSQSPLRGPLLHSPSGRKSSWPGAYASCQTQSAKTTWSAASRRTCWSR